VVTVASKVREKESALLGWKGFEKFVELLLVVLLERDRINSEFVEDELNRLRWCCAKNFYLTLATLDEWLFELAKHVGLRDLDANVMAERFDAR
jgi:hypothetical protein